MQLHRSCPTASRRAYRSRAGSSSGSSIGVPHRAPLAAARRAAGATRLTAAASRNNAEPEAAADASSRDTLDALLGQPEQQQPLHPDQQLVPWWQIKPRQSAAPRQTLLNPPGELARFVTDSAVYATRVRSGRSTQVGGELDLPQVEPFFCYLLLATQLAVYGAGTWLAVSQGPDAAEAMARELALTPRAMLEQGEVSRLATAMLLHGGLTHLAVDTFTLAAIGPGIEALLGHGVLLYIYSFSGLAGGLAVLLASGSADPIATSSAATLGLVGGMLGYELANRDIVKQSLKSRHSKAEDGKRGSSALRKPWGAIGLTALMFGLGLLPGSMVDNASHIGGLAAGMGLGYLMGPKFMLTQEVEIPVGSMSVPEDAAATVVVLDRRTGLQRGVVGVAAAGALAAALVLGGAAKHALLQGGVV